MSPLKKLPLAAAMLAVFFTSAQRSVAQLQLDGDFRLRSEYRHGFQNLAKKDQDPAFFTSQRSRLILGFRDEKYTVRFAVQDVRTWGSQSQTAISDGLLSIHEAWVDYNISKKIALKAGRMELAYDNHRILGNLDWAQQGRKHDLALLKFTDSTFAIHAGFAFNQDKEQSATTLYTVPNSYKTMQFIWVNKQFVNLMLSGLFLNNGTQYVVTDEAGTVVNQGTKFMQTSGLHAEFKKNRFFVTAFSYVQTGRDSKNRHVEAYDVNAEFGYKISTQLTLSAGAETLSGTSNVNGGSVNRSFTPLYGTNHIFNGYMDYFYVGNHNNNVGLRDAFLRLKHTLGKGFLAIDIHEFQSAAMVYNPETVRGMKRRLGTEVDITVRQPLSKELTLQAGYSHMFATTTMQVIKGGVHQATQNWAYLWLIFKPDFLKKRVN